jgi:hypothetical protein
MDTQDMQRLQDKSAKGFYLYAAEHTLLLRP